MGAPRMERGGDGKGGQGGGVVVGIWLRGVMYVASIPMTGPRTFVSHSHTPILTTTGPLPVGPFPKRVFFLW